ncbi:DNA-directed DNA polymerase epsilon, subunit B [Marasmius crinis-equi]|uniref:DNA polymerase epsilon subunit n=1 Tax=Marasmius crinis-equi TaxID=585013 RepID=A0ABR3F9U1_9AGAR
MSDARQRIIIKVFRKFSNSLGPDALDFLEQILDAHEIDDSEVESSVETIAKEYNKQDDASMKVSVELLQRVYNALQEDGQRSDGEAEIVDPESHLFVVDAFEMPRWHWSIERGTFEKAPGPSTTSGSAETRVACIRDRLNIIKQCVLRNEHFAPSTIPSKDRDRLVTLKSTKQLLGRAGERFLLLGMLERSKEGKLCLEDADGSVELDFSKLDEPGEGLFTEGGFALVEGEYTEDATLEIIAIGQPPCETRQTARSIYGHIDFLGKGSTSLLEDAQFSVRIREELPDLHFFFLSDVWLDHPKTLLGLKKMFDNCVENDFVPRIFLMELVAIFNAIKARTTVILTALQLTSALENFEALADLIAAYPTISRTSHFIFVPGPLDLTLNSTLPRRPLLSSFVSRLKAKVPKSHFTTNPCRIKFFDQEIVVFREDSMSRMLRNIIGGVKLDASGDDLKRYLVQSILDQAHLSPFANHIQPTLPDYDHALRLYPLPTAVILADKYDRFKITYTGCHVFNPGCFMGNNAFTFSTYKPSEINSEECVVEMDSAE